MAEMDRTALVVAIAVLVDCVTLVESLVVY